MSSDRLNHLSEIESEAIFILREAYAEFKKPVMLYSVGKDSSVLLHLAHKAFSPAKVPFPLMHVDTGYKFPEMYDFRDEVVKKYDVDLIVHKNEEWVSKVNPYDDGTEVCCSKLKTEALLQGIKKHKYDAAIGGARRDEEKSRAKERIYSHRDKHGQWDPKRQRPELWGNYNPLLREGETMRIFPLSNWTELDVWYYIQEENIPIVPLYFSKIRRVVVKDNILIPTEYDGVSLSEGDKQEKICCRFRSLGCVPCTGAVRSRVKTVRGIINEVEEAKRSERENRVIDLGSESSMEDKKKEGYF